MIRFIAGFLTGIFVAQNYEVGDLRKHLEHLYEVLSTYEKKR